METKSKHFPPILLFITREITKRSSSHKLIGENNFILGKKKRERERKKKSSI